MARSRRTEQRLLTRDEGEFVARTHHPALRTVPETELTDLIRHLRERRDRARDIAKRQRREMRGKATGAGGATDDTGSRAKRDVLAAALQRANKELTRRRADSAKGELRSSARRALAMRRAAEAQSSVDNPAAGDRTENEGMRPIPNQGIAPSGALDAEGHRPVVHRTRLPR